MRTSWHEPGPRGVNGNCRRALGTCVRHSGDLPQGCSPPVSPGSWLAREGHPDPGIRTAGSQKLVQAGHGVEAYLEGQVGHQEEEAENQQGLEEAASVACGQSGQA